MTSEECWTLLQLNKWFFAFPNEVLSWPPSLYNCAAPLPFLDSFVSAAYVCWQCGLELALRATDASPIFNVSHVYMEELCLDHDGARKTCAELFSK